VVQEVREKVEALITPRNLSIRPVLAHVNGENADADYFDRVLDFGTMVTADIGSLADPDDR
jgi:hypothetical protein